MKLCYRGNSYEYDPQRLINQKAEKPFQPVDQLGAAYNLIYRGANYYVDPHQKSVEVPSVPTTYQLIYRGIKYLVNKNAKGEVSIITQSPNKLGIEPKYV